MRVVGHVDVESVRSIQWGRLAVLNAKRASVRTVNGLGAQAGWFRSQPLLLDERRIGGLWAAPLVGHDQSIVYHCLTLLVPLLDTSCTFRVYLVCAAASPVR